MKQCSKCGEWKEEGMFEKKKNQCKACRAALCREWRANNREKDAARKKEYRANNREKVAAREKEYRVNNREKVAARKKEWHANNREKVAARSKEWRANNREKEAARRKEWYANNREKEAARNKEYRANNREKVAAWNKEYFDKLKTQAYAVLGGFRCVVPGCNNNDPRGLNIDHVNGDGFLERKKTKGGALLYRKIIATGGAGYQVLCAYHNQIKLFEQDEALRQALKWDDVFGQKVTAVLDVV